jgi:iron(III) transport system substrate-binding protein
VKALLPTVLGLAALAALAGALWYLWPGPRVVLYCAQDQDFARDVLEEFRRRTGLAVAPKFDTEADKSVSLYLELVKEAARPRCDVFWNNEILSSIRLQRQGLLEPYDSPGARALKPFPASAYTADHAWHAFAARARVLIVNTSRLPGPEDRPHGLLQLADERFRDRVVMARPEFGTSATQAACLFAVLGRERAAAYYRGLRRNGVQIAPGNKQVAEWVGQGRTPNGQAVAVGVTDTDDALEEVAAGSPVAVIFPDRDGGDVPGMGTLYIPNTVCILKGAPNPDGARQLVDYLLSAEVEGKLAEAGGHQIPFNPAVRDRLPAAVETPPAVKPMDVDFFRAADLWDEVQDFVRQEFARP